MTENHAEINSGNPFEGMAVISSYTRAEAIDDGVLVQVEEKIAKEAGFRWPVAVTDRVHNDVLNVPDHPKAMGQSYAGRLWDVLYMGAHAVRMKKRQIELQGLGDDDGRIIGFEVLATNAQGEQQLHKLWLVMSFEGDGGTPVLTIMFPEDY